MYSAHSFAKEIAAFAVSPGALQLRGRTTARRRDAPVRMAAAPDDVARVSRRSLLSGTATVALLQLLPALSPEVAKASVDIDLDRFGDKGTRLPVC